MEKNSVCGFCSSRRMLLKMGGAVGAAMLMGSADVRIGHAAAVGTLEERIEIAAGRFGAMSCAQALASAYADLAGLSERQAKDLASGFGLGMGRKQSCGALTVALMLSGLAGKGGECSSLMDAFEKEMGSTQCAFFVDRFGYSRCRELIRFASRRLNERVFA